MCAGRGGEGEAGAGANRAVVWHDLQVLNMHVGCQA